MSTPAYIIRFVLSPREYEVITTKWNIKAPLAPKDLRESEKSGAEPHRLIRQHVRLFLKTWAVTKLVEKVVEMRSPGAVENSPAGKIAGSATLLSAIYRILYPILARALSNKVSGTSFEKTRELLVPFVAGLLASGSFALFPEAAREYIALYTASKAAEFVYNYLDDRGYFYWKPRALGSWLLFPVAMSQLFATFIQEPAWSPRSFSAIMLKLRGSYGPNLPHGYPDAEAWPTDNDWLSSIAEVARLRFPKFKSHMVFRHQKPFPETLRSVFPVLRIAHPGNTTFTGAILHPETDSEWQPFLETVLGGYASTTKYLLPLYLLFGFLRNHRDFSSGLLGSTIANTLRTATFISMTTASAWAGIGLSQSLLGNKMPVSARFRIIGFMSGLWAFLDQVNGRTRSLYALRLAILSQYNIIVSKRGGKPLLHRGDLVVFGLAFATIMTVFNKSPEAISSPGLRKSFNWMKTGNFEDPTPLIVEKTEIEKE